MPHKLACLILALTVLPSLASAQTTAAKPLDELGAANWVPADSAYFASTLRLGEQWSLLRDSNAMQTVLALPAVKLGMAAVLNSPQWRRFEKMRDDAPEVDTGVEVLGDALSQEVFVCLDARWAALLDRIAAGYLDLLVTAMQSAASGHADDEAAMRRVMLRHLATLELPGSLVGFRLRDPARAKQLFDALFTNLSAVLPITKQTIDGGEFHVLQLEAGMVQAAIRNQWRRGLLASAIDEQQVAQFDAWVDKQKLAIAVGLRDDYLLVSIGPDTQQLQALGAEHALAASAAFAPVRKVAKPGVIGIDYVSPDLSNRRPFATEALGSRLGAVLEAAGARLPKGLAERLQRDVPALLTELNLACGEPQAEVAVSFQNRGIESYSFQAARRGDMDASKPLSIVEHAGPAPLLLLASRGQPMRPAFEQFAHWVGVAFSYFEDFAVPGMHDKARTEFEQFRSTFVPLAQRLETVTRDELLPAIDGCQSLLVLDGGGVLTGLPNLPELPKPLRYPRPAIVHELNDGAAFINAWSHYREAVNDMLATLAKDNPSMRPTSWPAPRTKDFAGSTRYSYDLPLPPAFGLSPGAVVTADRLLLTLDEAQAHALLSKTPLPDGELVDLHANAGSLLRIDLAALTAMLADDVGIVVDALHEAKQMNNQVHQLVRAHLPGLRDALGALRSFSSRTWVEGDREVTHSWLHVQDIRQ